MKKHAQTSFWTKLDISDPSPFEAALIALSQPIPFLLFEIAIVYEELAVLNQYHLPSQVWSTWDRGKRPDHFHALESLEGDIKHPSDIWIILIYLKFHKIDSIKRNKPLGKQNSLNKAAEVAPVLFHTIQVSSESSNMEEKGSKD